MLRDDPHDTDDVGVELLEILRWNPIFNDRSATYFVRFLSIDEVLLHLERGDVADAARVHIPILAIRVAYSSLSTG